MITVTPTTDETYLRRWMLRPSFLSKMGVRSGDAAIEPAFLDAISSPAVFFDVRVDGDEKGCIILFQNAAGFDLHLCLATWWRDTREALRQAMQHPLVAGRRVLASFPAARRSVHRLLDDVGFSTGTVESGTAYRCFPS